MSSNYQIATDLAEAKSMAENLATYVRGDQLFGSTGGSFASSGPGLTTGALIMRLRRLNALRDSLSQSQQNELDTIIQTWKSAREEWRYHYEQKLVQEIETRLKSMKAFFRECAESPSNCSSNYRPELLKRTIIQELLREIDALNVETDVREAVQRSDSMLNKYVFHADFQWSDVLQTVYPQDEFWWLYRKPRD